MENKNALALDRNITMQSLEEFPGPKIPSCCKEGMNITATAELRVWLEVPDTA